jgi:hypothetical protein
MEHLFVSIKRSPYSHFRRALDTGNLALIRTAEAARGPDAARRHAKGDDGP